MYECNLYFEFLVVIFLIITIDTSIDQVISSVYSDSAAVLLLYTFVLEYQRIWYMLQVLPRS